MDRLNLVKDMMEVNPNALLTHFTVLLADFCFRLGFPIRNTPWQQGTVMKSLFFHSLQRCLMLITREKIVFKLQHRDYEAFLGI